MSDSPFRDDLLARVERLDAEVTELQARVVALEAQKSPTTALAKPIKPIERKSWWAGLWFGRRARWPDFRGEVRCLCCKHADPDRISQSAVERENSSTCLPHYQYEHWYIPCAFWPHAWVEVHYRCKAFEPAARFIVKAES